MRQISNPMSGVDTTLLALAGCGQQRAGAFGFMSCDRTIGAAEGCNVVQERRVRRGAWPVPGACVGCVWLVTLRKHPDSHAA